MSRWRSFGFLLWLTVIVALVAGCAAPAATPAPAPAAAEEAAATEAAPAEAAPAEKPYIPVISKGFQHQFWQAVKLGAERAAADYNV
ncbi:MAG: hypothetical protein NZ553_10255, partial [Caldilinea sp.]|nr:hypothetical protein [Caldilinea sp.]MDW8440842.1 hypothetical protein [Caldilineaceae bacterium]